MEVSKIYMDICTQSSSWSSTVLWLDSTFFFHLLPSTTTRHQVLVPWFFLLNVVFQWYSLFALSAVLRYEWTLNRHQSSGHFKTLSRLDMELFECLFCLIVIHLNWVAHRLLYIILVSLLWIITVELPHNAFAFRPSSLKGFYMSSDCLLRLLFQNEIFSF